MIKSSLRRLFPLTTVMFVTVTLLSTVLTSRASEEHAPGLSRAEIIRLGEKMYREGVLPSGSAMPAYIRGDVEIDSTAFSCSSCHLRAGFGSVEGGVITPPTTGKKLYSPYHRPAFLEEIPDRVGRNFYAKTVVERPAYNRETLSAALRFGRDPSGQQFNDVMPRYPLSDNDMAILVSYLELLSEEPSPGISRDELKFATIITDDVSNEDRQALLMPIRSIIDQKNQQWALYRDFKKFGYQPTLDMKYAFRQTSLDVWELKGPPATWQAQLAEYSSKNPVFAVLGGISNRDWQPVHDFCEKERLPCLFPITPFPPLTETGWYTYYFDKGYAQEGEAVAKYLGSIDASQGGQKILQIVQDSMAGRALMAGFDSRWRELKRPSVTTVIMTAEQLADKNALAALIRKEKPEALILWATENLPAGLPHLVAGLGDKVPLFVSSGYLAGKTRTIPEGLRSRVYISYPYRLTPYVGPKTGGADSKFPVLSSARDLSDRRISSRTINVLQQAIFRSLSLLQDNLLRDNLMDIMSMQMDMVVKDYERISFGPGQRYVSKGCYIIQLGPGDEPALIPRSEWVMN